MFVSVRKNERASSPLVFVRESASPCEVSTRDGEAVIRTQAPSRFALGAVFDGVRAATERKKHSIIRVYYLGAYRGSGILPCEEMGATVDKERNGICQ